MSKFLRGGGGVRPGFENTQVEAAFFSSGASLTKEDTLMCKEASTEHTFMAAADSAVISLELDIQCDQAPTQS